MIKSFLSILLVASRAGNTLAFSSSRQFISRTIQDTSLSLNDDDDYSSTNTENRRAFLVNFAAVPILTTFANNAAYARDDGKLVYGGEWIVHVFARGDLPLLRYLTMLQFPFAMMFR